MEEQLELIQKLRLEVNSLISDKDKIKEDYETVDKVVLYTFNNIQNLYKELEKSKDNLDNIKFIRTLKHSIFVGVIVAISMFISVITNGFDQIFIKVLGSTAIGAMSMVLTSTFLSSSKIVNRFLVKKCPEIRDSYNKINNLEIAIRMNEKRFDKMKEDRDNLKITLRGISEQLERKREELDSVEEEYFSSLAGKSFTTEDGKHFIVGFISRSKTRVKIPDNITKNLGN